MKRSLCLIAALSLILTLAACAQPSPEAEQEQRYQMAVARMEAGFPASALPLFRSLGHYRDAALQRRHCAFAALRSYITSHGSPYTPMDDGGAVVTYDNALTQGGSITRYAALDQRGRLVLGCGRASEHLGSWVYTITLEENSSYAEASFLGLQRFGAPTFFQGSASLFLCNYVRDRSVDFPVTQWQDRQGVFAQRQLSEAYGRRDLQAIQTLPVAAAESFLEQAGVTLADLGFWGVEDVGETVVS